MFDKLRTGIALSNSDCLESMGSIPDKSIDLILCDLPYGTTQNKWDEVIDLNLLWSEYWRLAKPTTPIVLTAQSPFDKILGSSCIKYLKYEWIWEKDQATGHLNAKKQPMKSHENVLVFYKSQPLYNPQKTKGKPVRMVKNQSNASPNYGKQEKTIYESDERYPRSVIYIPKDSKNKNIHPTQKPVELMSYMIKTYTNEGMIVLDNCMGAGTTGVACLKENRRFLGIEKDPEYYRKAKERLLSYEI